MPEKSIREQLLEARSKIQRQIDILRMPVAFGWPYRPDKEATIEMLLAKLQEIDEALAGLKADDS